MKKDYLILAGAAVAAYMILNQKPAAKMSSKPLPTTGDFARLDRKMAEPDTLGALGEPVQVFPNAIWV